MWSQILKVCSMTFVCVLGVLTAPHVWALTVTPSSLTFQAVQGGINPPGQLVNVSKANNKTVNWTASDSAAWVSVTPLTGSITSAAQVTVTVNPAGLAAGTYTATVAITVSKGGSISIPVSLIVAAASTSTSASISWSPPSTGTVAGYNVYVGTTSGVYGPAINVGNVTSYVLNNLAPGTYYFVVTDYDSGAVESLPSTEVSKTIY